MKLYLTFGWTLIRVGRRTFLASKAGSTAMVRAWENSESMFGQLFDLEWNRLAAKLAKEAKS